MSIDLNLEQTYKLIRMVSDAKNGYVERASNLMDQSDIRRMQDMPAEQSETSDFVGASGWLFVADSLRGLEGDIQRGMSQWTQESKFEFLGPLNIRMNSKQNAESGSLSLGPITDFGASLVSIIISVHISDSASYDYKMLDLLRALHQDQITQ